MAAKEKAQKPLTPEERQRALQEQRRIMMQYAQDCETFGSLKSGLDEIVKDKQTFKFFWDSTLPQEKIFGLMSSFAYIAVLRMPSETDITAYIDLDKICASILAKEEEEQMVLDAAYELYKQAFDLGNVMRANSREMLEKRTKENLGFDLNPKNEGEKQ